MEEEKNRIESPKGSSDVVEEQVLDDPYESLIKIGDRRINNEKSEESKKIPEQTEENNKQESDPYEELKTLDGETIDLSPTEDEKILNSVNKEEENIDDVSPDFMKQLEEPSKEVETPKDEVQNAQNQGMQKEQNQNTNETFPGANGTRKPMRSPDPTKWTDWLPELIIGIIPFFNIIMYIYWVFSDHTSKVKIEFCKAWLVVQLAFYILLQILYIGLGVTFLSLLDGLF